MTLDETNVAGKACRERFLTDYASSVLHSVQFDGPARATLSCRMGYDEFEVRATPAKLPGEPAAALTGITA